MMGKSNRGRILKHIASLGIFATLFSATAAIGGHEEVKQNIRNLSNDIYNLSAHSTASGEDLDQAVGFLRKAKKLLTGFNDRVVLEDVLDVSIHGGSHWVIRTDGSVFMKSGQGDFVQIPFPGTATKIRAINSGAAFAISSGSQILEWRGAGWSQRPGLGIDVGGNANGGMCIIGTNLQPHCMVNGVFTGFPGKGLRIDVQSDGTAWMIGTNNNLYVWRNNSWNWPNGQTIYLSDIFVAADDALYGVEGSGNVVKIDQNTGSVSVIESGAIAAATTATGGVFTVTSDFLLLRPKR